MHYLKQGAITFCVISRITEKYKTDTPIATSVSISCYNPIEFENKLISDKVGFIFEHHCEGTNSIDICEYMSKELLKTSNPQKENIVTKSISNSILCKRDKYFTSISLAVFIE